MNYYYFELFLNSKLYFKELFKAESKELADKYSSYKEQSLREINHFNDLIHSKLTVISEINEITTDLVNSLEKILIENSTLRAQMIENIRKLNNF